MEKTKLTVRVPRDLLDDAKRYARENNTSLSRLVSGVEYIVTRSPRDYRAGPLPVLQPAELLALL